VPGRLISSAVTVLAALALVAVASSKDAARAQVAQHGAAQHAITRLLVVSSAREHGHIVRWLSRMGPLKLSRYYPLNTLLRAEHVFGHPRSCQEDISDRGADFRIVTFVYSVDTNDDGCERPGRVWLQTALSHGLSWATEQGLRVGDTLARLHHLYPHAHTTDFGVDGDYTIVSTWSPGCLWHGRRRGETVGLIDAYVQDRKVVNFGWADPIASCTHNS
jgi:hypothetical protein